VKNSVHMSGDNRSAGNAVADPGGIGQALP
jgi:hypothetical protein